MKILSLTNSPLDPSLGSGKTVLRWSQGLRDLGHEVEVYEPKDFQVLQGMRRGWKFRTAWGAWQFFKEKVRPQDYDLIEFYGDEFWLILRHLSSQKNRPLLVAHTNGLELLATERERKYNPPQSLRDRAYLEFAKQIHDRFSHIAFVNADVFVSICERDRHYMLDSGLYPREKTASIMPGLDVEYLSIPFTPERAHRVAYVGSWTQRKGLGQLCTVMGNLLSKYPNLTFDLYGTNTSPEIVIANFPSAIQKQITIHPRLPTQKIAEGLAKAKVFFFPSQYEGFGMAVAEAMACGCAAVTTPTGFGADLEDGEDALICDFEDIPAMERAIETLLNDEDLRSKIARNGYQRVQDLRWDLAVSKLERIYLDWLNVDSPRSNCPDTPA
ncbi:glycosyltransferase family 4 protein [Lusitaniella coriacea LEGE 07157]|uniref:Glycosyltransferase family 4 protein n=1 Tax=Lusitaniella coriacea LEGE 07157 TaxID=945747 RepID=A0A8J7E446_9CYAN|nr:glycosyltransferase family 4 protein [Lusitaniella coriacea]MBE9118274.1 glycosyltransferase family 4 protein [Lusitaniella coriacea LEGE 07157]